MFVLEHVGTPEAREVLKLLAEGDRVAKAAPRLGLRVVAAAGKVGGNLPGRRRSVRALGGFDAVASGVELADSGESREELVEFSRIQRMPNQGLECFNRRRKAIFVAV